MIFDPDDPRLTAFALGELDEADRRSVESLLASSPEAARFVAEVRETAALLSESLRKEPMPGLSIVQRLDLDATIGTVASPEPLSLTSRRFPVRRALVALAASVLLATSGFGIGVLVASRTVATADRAVVFAPSATPPMAGAMGGVAKPDMEAARSATSRLGEPLRETPAAELDAVLGMERMRARSNAVASDEVRDAASVPLAMDLAVPESPSPGFARSLPRRAKEPGPQLEAEAMTPQEVVSEDAVADRARPEDGRAFDGRETRGMAFRGMRGGLEGTGPGGRTTDSADEAPASLTPEPPMIPPPVLPRNEDEERQRRDRVLSKRAAAVVGTPSILERRQGLKPSQGVALQPGNVVEVVNLPDGTPAQRFVLEEPIREVVVDPSGSRLLASTGERSLAVFDLQSGQLTNAFQVDRGPVPVARFGQGGELIFSNLGVTGTIEDEGVGFLWFQAQLEPVAAVPVNPGRVSIPELGRRIEAEGLPIGPETLTGSLVNSPAYPYDQPDAEDLMAVDVRVVPSPWSEGNRVVRLALIARNPMPDAGDAGPSVVVEEVTAEVEFNPARVARYRPIGFEGRPLTLARVGEKPQVLRAGESSTVLFEIEPRETPGDPADGRQGRAGRYQGPPALGVAEDELLTVSVAYREPGADVSRSLTRHVVDAVTPIDEAPDELRLALGLGWIGLVVQGMIDGDRATLDRIKSLVESRDEGFLPAVRADLETLLRQVEHVRAKDEPVLP